MSASLLQFHVFKQYSSLICMKDMKRVLSACSVFPALKAIILNRWGRKILPRFGFTYPFPCEQYCINLLSALLVIFDKNSVQKLKQMCLFFHQGFLSGKLTTHRAAGKRRGPFFYSTLPLSPAHEHSDIYLQLCM